MTLVENDFRILLAHNSAFQRAHDPREPLQMLVINYFFSRAFFTELLMDRDKISICSV